MGTFVSYIILQTKLWSPTARLHVCVHVWLFVFNGGILMHTCTYSYWYLLACGEWKVISLPKALQDCTGYTLHIVILPLWVFHCTALHVILHACIHVHTFMHTHLHAYTQHVHLHECLPTTCIHCLRTYLPTYPHMHTYTHACNSFMHIDARNACNPHIHACNSCIHAHIQYTHISTYMHPSIRT